jgi:hypothetical protein
MSNKASSSSQPKSSKPVVRPYTSPVAQLGSHRSKKAPKPQEQEPLSDSESDTDLSPSPFPYIPAKISAAEIYAAFRFFSSDGANITHEDLERKLNRYFPNLPLEEHQLLLGTQRILKDSGRKVATNDPMSLPMMMALMNVEDHGLPRNVMELDGRLQLTHRKDVDFNFSHKVNYADAFKVQLTIYRRLMADVASG